MIRQARFLFPLSVAMGVAVLMGSVLSCAEEPSVEQPAVKEVDGEQPAVEKPTQPAEEKPAEGKKSGLVRIGKDAAVWIDPKRKVVVVDGEVVLREGQLEMFACPKSTKEHESVVAVYTKAYVVHAALLAVGAKTGHPVRFSPKYVPASGTEVDIVVSWTDKDGKRHKDRAQDWIRHVGTGKPMKHKWVFAGSGFWVDEETGQRHYQAEGGDLICVSNFSTATLDLPIKSSRENSDLLFECFSENIPPLGTKVRLVLVPKREGKESGKKNGGSKDK